MSDIDKHLFVCFTLQKWSWAFVLEMQNAVLNRNLHFSLHPKIKVSFLSDIVGSWVCLFPLSLSFTICDIITTTCLCTPVILNQKEATEMTEVARRKENLIIFLFAGVWNKHVFPCSHRSRSTWQRLKKMVSHGEQGEDYKYTTKVWNPCCLHGIGSFFVHKFMKVSKVKYAGKINKFKDGWTDGWKVLTSYIVLAGCPFNMTSAACLFRCCFLLKNGSHQLTTEAWPTG